MATSLITLGDVKSMMNITGTGSDVDLQSVIDATTRVIEARVGAIDPATYTRTFPGNASDTLVLGHTHVTGVSAVVVVSDGSSPVTLGANLVIDAGQGIVRLKVGVFPGEPFQVTYGVGRTAPFDPNLIEAAKLIVQDMFTVRRSKGAGSGHAQAGDTPTPADYLIPRRALALLGIDSEPYGFA